MSAYLAASNTVLSGDGNSLPSIAIFYMLHFITSFPKVLTFFDCSKFAFVYTSSTRSTNFWINFVYFFRFSFDGTYRTNFFYKECIFYINLHQLHILPNLDRLLQDTFPQIYVLRIHF